MARTESWENEGVKVSVDDDSAQIIKKDYGNPPEPSDFNIVRPLVNFEVKVGSGHPSVPITFIACYNSSDLSKVNGKANKLKLVYWNQQQNKWKNIPITGPATIPSGFSGFEGAFTALINASWPDPAVGWGDGGG